MDINRTRRDKWKTDTQKSVEYYNNWFIKFAPKAFREVRCEAIEIVEEAMKGTDEFRSITSRILKGHPYILPAMRMATLPTLAEDRLAGLTGVPKATIKTLDDGKLPARLEDEDLNEQLNAITKAIQKLIDKDLMPWLEEDREIENEELAIAVNVIADRLCSALADPTVRNAQEERQLNTIAKYLEECDYNMIKSNSIRRADDMPAGSYAYHLNIPVEDNDGKMNRLPIDVAIKPFGSKGGEMPILIECKSAGDFANTNKRRKEEAQKVSQLRKTYGEKRINYILFLGGYFDTSYLEYEAAEGIDWVWEHNVSELEKAGI